MGETTMPIPLPPTPVIAVHVTGLDADKWNYDSETPHLVDSKGRIDFLAANITRPKVVVDFKVDTVGAPDGVTAQFDTSAVDFAVWSLKENSCDKADKQGSDSAQDTKILYTHSDVMEVRYGNFTHGHNSINLKCSLYKITILVGDANNNPRPVSPDPIIANGDGNSNFCLNPQLHRIVCVDRRLRKHKR
jgi:hypothetical protein